MSELGLPILATAADLPPAVGAALATPSPGRRTSVDAAGIRFSAIEWTPGADAGAGAPAPGPGDPLLLVHGVTSSCRTWWRVGPCLAAAGWHVVAPDLPGHGLTGSWQGRHRFIESAEDVASFARAAGLTVAGDGALTVLGHSWGSMIAAALPSAGLTPRRIVLLDPPAMSREQLEAMAYDPVDRHYDSYEEALVAVGAAHPEWIPEDVAVKAETLVQFDEAAARAILLDNRWDAGLRALADPAAADVPIRVVRGEPASGGLLPDDLLPAVAARVGSDHVLTIVDGPHSPQRTHPEATVLALLRALTM
jgi:pimeloyl-ACP methyl ester carboxylesterase